MIWVLVRTRFGPPTLPGRGPLTDGPCEESSSSLRRKTVAEKKGRPRSRRRLRQKNAAPTSMPVKAGAC
jgi:hypothetical protein